MALSTRERIIEAAVELFAARGYNGTTISAIEERAGLSPGAGGLYRHFATKQEVVEAALAPIAESVDQLEHARSLLPLGDLRAELLLLARGGLVGIAASRRLLRIIERDPDVVPVLRDLAREQVIERGYAVAARFINDLADAHQLPRPTDPEALARMAIGTLTNQLREAEAYGPASHEVDERLLTAWVDVFYTYLTAANRRAAPR